MERTPFSPGRTPRRRKIALVRKKMRFICLSIFAILGTLFSFLLIGTIDYTSYYRKKSMNRARISASSRKKSAICSTVASFEPPPYVLEWKQRSFVFHKNLGFIQFSSYRIQEDKFAILGMQDTFQYTSELTNRRPPFKGTCQWFDANDKVLMGKLSFFYGGETHDRAYEVLVLHCSLRESTGKCGGYLVGQIDGVEIILFREDEDQETVLNPPQGSFQNKVTHCSPPLHRELHPGAVKEWMDYHRVLFGVDRFVFYDAGAVNSSLLSALTAYVEHDRLEVSSFSQPVLQRAGRAWDYARGLALNDCLYRSRFTSKWVIALDFEDYLQLAPGVTLSSILSGSLNSDRPWMTIGSVLRVTDHCKGDSEQAAAKSANWHLFHTSSQPSLLSRLTFRFSEPSCMDAGLFPNRHLCLLHYGHRTFVADPRKTSLVQTHSVLVPLKGGKHLSAKSEIWKNSFPGISSPQGRGSLCSKIVHEADQISHSYLEDCSVSEGSLRAAACSVANNSNCRRKSWE